MSLALANPIIDNSAFSLSEIQSGLSCDWLSIYQDHDDIKGKFPKYDGGVILNLDSEGFYTTKPFDESTGEVLDQSIFDQKIVDLDDQRYYELWRSFKKLQLKGSHDTSLLIFSDGHRVIMIGNVGRFGRLDNVFNLSFSDTIKKANEILAHLGLPPFTFGKSYYLEDDKGKKKTMRQFGAVITRIDANINIHTGSPANARELIRYLSSRSMTHVGRQVYSSTIIWGKGRNQSKAYDKAQEMLDHCKHKSKKIKDAILNSYGYKFAYENGLVRFELTLDRKTLADTHLRDIENVTDEVLAMALKKKLDQVISEPEQKIDRFDPLSIFKKKKHISTLTMWMSHLDLKDTRYMSQSTFSRHRREILAISGIDIAVPFINKEESFGVANLYKDFDLKVSKCPKEYPLIVDVKTVMPDVDLNKPLGEWEQSNRNDNVIDFQKYQKDQETKKREIEKRENQVWGLVGDQVILKSQIFEVLCSSHEPRKHALGRIETFVDWDCFKNKPSRSFK